MYNCLSLNVLLQPSTTCTLVKGKAMAIEYSDLAQLPSRASRVEQCIVKKE